MAEEEFAEARVTVFDIFRGIQPTGIRVEWRGDDLWAVMRGQEALSRSGKWDFEPLPSSRTDRWKETHRFKRDVAIDLAMSEVEK